MRSALNSHYVTCRDKPYIHVHNHTNITYLNSIEHFLYVVSVFVQGLPRGGEERYGLGALLHQGHASGWRKPRLLKEIEDETVNIVIHNEMEFLIRHKAQDIVVIKPSIFVLP